VTEDSNQDHKDEDEHAGWNKNIDEARVRNIFQPVVPLAEYGRHSLNLLRQFAAAGVSTPILGVLLPEYKT
jgi:hypothetical protein